MKKLFVLILALKNLKGHRMRSILTILGMGIGIGFIVFLISLAAGLKKVSTEEIANLEALSVMDVTPGKSKIVKINDESLDKIYRLGDIEKTFPSVSLPVRIEHKSSAIDSVLYGKNADFLNLEEIRFEKGGRYETNDKKEVLINTAALNQLGIKDKDSLIGDKIKLTFSLRPDLLKDGEVTAKKVEDEFTIKGIIKKEDTPYIYIPLNVLKTYGVEKYTNIKVKASSQKKVDTLKQKIENMGFRVTAIKNTLDQINQFFEIFQLILLSFGLVAIVVASIGMFNTLTISLLEKTREIGFMKALGTTRRDIYRIFVTEAVLLGIIGGSLGTLLGLTVGNGLNTRIATLAERTGNKPVEIFYMPLEYIIYVLLFTFIISFLTGLYPSYRASRINALDALRYE